MDKTTTTIVALVFLVALAALIWFAVRNLRGAVDNVRNTINTRRHGQVVPEAVAPNRLNRISAEREAAAAYDAATPSPDEDAAPTAPDAKVMAEEIVAAMTAQLAELDDWEERRGTEPCKIRLVPQIPIRDIGTAQSWLGGRPRLPAELDWPIDAEGVPLDFIAQIGCAGLPADLWGGIGPRSGWLLYFVHPETGEPFVYHLEEDGVPRDPPRPISDTYFSHHFAKADHGVPLPHRAFPEWPVDMVVVRPGDPDPLPDPVTGTVADRHDRYKAGYDFSDPALHPFDWPSMLALASILEGKTGYFWRDLPPGPSPLDTQLENARNRLEEGERAAERPDNLDALRAQVEFLPRLIAASRAARETNDAARAQIAQIVAVIRESHDAGEPFSPRDAAAVIDALAAIEWTKVNRKSDPDKRPGSELVEVKTLPLTRHDPDADLWVHTYAMCHEDMAKHAYCADPGSLPAAARAFYEEEWRREMLRGMASIGNYPSAYVHEFDVATDVMLLERPTCYLLNWIVGDCHDMVLTMKRDDLAAGNWDALIYQVSN